jgi:hypothetical protein
MNHQDFQKLSHVRDYVSEIWFQGHDLDNLPTSAPTCTEDLLRLLAEDYGPYAWMYALSPYFAADLTRAVQSFRDHEKKKWFVSSLFFALNRNLDTTTIFWKIPLDKQSKYIHFAEWKAGIIETSLNTSREHLFLRDGHEQSTPGAVKLNPNVSLSISGLSPNGLLDEAWAFTGAFVHQNVMWVKDETVQQLIHDNDFLPLLMGIMYYNNLQKK